MNYIEYKTNTIKHTEKLNYIVVSDEDLHTILMIFQKSIVVNTFKVFKKMNQLKPEDLKLSKEFFTKWV